MANSLSNIQRTAFVAFEETLSQGASQFQKIGPIYTEDQQNLDFDISQSGGGFTAYTAVGSSVTKDILSGKVSHSSSAYAKTEKLTFKDLRDRPDLPAIRARAMANEAMAQITGQAMAGLEALFSTAHPLAGSAATRGLVGTGKKFLDTGLAYDANAGTQDNLLTEQLSRAALVGAREKLRNWKRVGSGLDLNIGEEAQDLVLVCAPANEDLAFQLLRSGNVDANLQSNFLFGWAEPVIFPLASDDDDWFVISRTAAPVGMWIRQMPSISMMPDSSTAGLDWIMSASLIADFVYDVEGAGIIGSNVA